ncbi:uncharacterized protein V6R79_008110 [Siganus canaliculatus]
MIVTNWLINELCLPWRLSKRKCEGNGMMEYFHMKSNAENASKLFPSIQICALWRSVQLLQCGFGGRSVSELVVRSFFFQCAQDSQSQSVTAPSCRQTTGLSSLSLTVFVQGLDRTT